MHQPWPLSPSPTQTPISITSLTADPMRSLVRSMHRKECTHPVSLCIGHTTTAAQHTNVTNAMK